MTTRFADTVFYIALLNPRDEYHETACKLAAAFGGSMVTTAWVITEVANQMSKPRNRAEFVSLLSDLENHDRVDILPPDRELYDRGLQLYAKRMDKEWSLTDCISFVVMEDRGLTEAMTADHHFEQAGFTILLE